MRRKTAGMVTEEGIGAEKLTECSVSYNCDLFFSPMVAMIHMMHWGPCWSRRPQYVALVVEEFQGIEVGVHSGSQGIKGTEFWKKPLSYCEVI